MVSNAPKVAKRSRVNRTTISCDRCKARKTKCNKPDADGPCDYCRNIDEVCSIDIAKRRQKPFYFVSEEEYRLLRDLCSQFYPDEDLTLPTLRRLASERKNGPRQELRATVTNAEPSIEGSEGVETPDKSPPGVSTVQEDLLLPEITSLHHDLGCLLPDAHGEYRYMGPESGISFNGAVRSWILRLGTRTKPADKDKIPPLLKVSPPATMSTLSFPPSPGSPSELVPPEKLLTACADRFFEQVHCFYWLYSSEYFYTRLETTYSGDITRLSGSWLCSLQSLVALVGPSEASLGDGQRVTESLEKAKALVPRVCDESDLDSIRALILLALALQSNGFTNPAYVYVGLAVRIAFSLGLHLDKYSTKDGVVAREYARRLWWTLFLFDQDLSLQLGKPSMTVCSASSAWQPPIPSECVVGPGLHTPHGYLEQAIALARLTKDIRQHLYDGPVYDGQILSQSHFTDAIKSLETWLHNMPPHLSLSISVSPLYRRSLSLLHLRYWSIVMLVTKPFLLYSLLRRDELTDPKKQAVFAELSATCLSAAESSFDILGGMIQHNAVSSLVVTDFFFALQTLQVIIAARGLYDGDVYQDRVKRCLKILMVIGVSGYPKHLLPETVFQLQQSGLVQGDDDTGSAQLPEPLNNLDGFIQRARRDQFDQDPNAWLNELDMTDVIIDDELWENMDLSQVFPLETGLQWVAPLE